MLETLLRTKFYVPPLRPFQLPRPRLIEKVNQGLQQGRKLTLISAPAGFGKTTLAVSWVHNLRLRIDDLRLAAAEEENRQSTIVNLKSAWLSLDEGDNDPARFLVYLSAALNQIKGISPPIGKNALSLLQAAQPPPLESVLTSLINDMAAVAGEIILVLDDYHVIESTAVDDALTFLLDHLPPQMHLLITTREDPDLPLARYRARGQLTEVRAADLRFTHTETAGFLNEKMALDLSAADVAALETRTEGWIAGLQLAALALQNLPAPEPQSTPGATAVTSFVQSFAGSHRFVLEYLLQEVLLRQPEQVRTFLLQTAVLDRLTGPLCDAVTQQEGGSRMLELLERGNLFLVSLDDRRRWYRYHHLFADALRVLAMEARPDQVPVSHERASAWFEQNGLTAEAIRHALAAKAFARAAALIEMARPAMDVSYESATWLGWVRALPDALVRSRPVLSAGYAWALLDVGEMEASETRLRDAERWLVAADDAPGEMVVVDQVQFRSLPASIATARAYRALALGDIPGTVAHARQALDAAPVEDHQWRGAASSLLGLAQYARGNLEAADRALSDFFTNMQKAGKISEAISIIFTLAEIKVTLGRLRAAVTAYGDALQLATGQEALPLGTADLYRGMSELYLEQGHLETAVQHLQTAAKLGEQSALTDWQHRLCVAQARLKEASGDLDGALALLDKAEQLYVRSPLPDVRPIPALKTRVWVRQGRLADAWSWVRAQGMSAADEAGYMREFEYITLARVLVARYRVARKDKLIGDATTLLERLQQAAESGKRLGSLIEILVLQALAHEAEGDMSAALRPLAHALVLAEPEGYLRIFVDEGQPMAALLAKLRENEESIVPSVRPGETLSAGLKTYIDKLLAAVGEQEGSYFGTMPDNSAPPVFLAEPLSDRELEVLRLLGTELSGPEIAHKLMVSVNTMRTHTKNIYSKLGVHSRRAAVRRAQVLDLL